MFRDEKGNLSAARLFILLWSIFAGVAIFTDPPGAFWSTASAVLLGLISWAAGPRIAQYIGGQISGAAPAVASKFLGGENGKAKAGYQDNAVGDGGSARGGSGGSNIST